MATIITTTKITRKRKIVRTSITKIQETVISRIFAGEGEDEILKSLKIPQAVYRRWLKSEKYQKMLEQKIEDCQRQAKIMIASYQLVAAAKLVNLMQCDKEQTARQACLDILQMELITPKVTKDEKTDEHNKLLLGSKAAAAITRILASQKAESETQIESRSQID
jgi:hypothetical protein